ncbi:SDR family NAD(P)-dependent oxidoreductase [Hyunsoonleella sp. SJ7]|uniref:SDR family NAD(P)-dependent oxidoreductase n=1 Tax=Hyunsoonleella aquatilis TaxID=2762758 RepID=A0A923HAA8_9FLAO|nr:SDR family NAD(P)-dependent oxidoreductase [Hyunsoonleella aquatilis]MBC3759408.1 SDR family NAD(P)-dependent oxidoreductase [Hyunsoonleella aquatilis]
MNKKIVLITGASKGIGLALAKKMLNENFFVVGTSRTGKISDIENDNFYSLKLDLSKPRSIENAYHKISKKFDRIDILINNAGIGPDLYTYSPEIESFKSTFDVNVTGTVFFTEKLIDLISNNGIVLNISSKMGSINVCKLTDSIAYRMSKSALNMYTKILTNRLKDKIRVAVIHPGWVKTSIVETNLKNGRLTPEQSAENIFKFIKSNFTSGTFWNSENESELLW